MSENIEYINKYLIYIDAKITLFSFWAWYNLEVFSSGVFSIGHMYLQCICKSSVCEMANRHYPMNRRISWHGTVLDAIKIETEDGYTNLKLDRISSEDHEHISDHKILIRSPISVIVPRSKMQPLRVNINEKLMHLLTVFGQRIAYSSTMDQICTCSLIIYDHYNVKFWSVIFSVFMSKVVIKADLSSYKPPPFLF